jgi:TIR domain
MMRLFINYAHSDKAEVEQVVSALRKDGHEVWFEKLLPGQDWEAILLQAISASDGLIYALSSDSVVTQWCQWELVQAVKLGKPVVPLVVTTPVKIPETIKGLRRVDISDGVSGSALAQLLGVVRRLENFQISADAPEPVAPEHPLGIPAQAMGTMVPPGMRGGSPQATEE